MGKFSGVLIASDFDNTLVYTEEALRLGLPTPPMSRANREAIEDFMARAAYLPSPRAGPCPPSPRCGGTSP